MKSVRTADGTDIAFEVYGEAGPFIMLGAPFVASVDRSPLEIMAPISALWLAELTPHFRVIAPDLPRGLGRTGGVQGYATTVDSVIADYSAVADAVGAQRFGWVGFSWGCGVGIQMARRTDRIAALAVGGYPPIDQPTEKMLSICEHVVQHAPPPFDSEVSKQFVGYYRDLMGWDSRTEVAKIACPRLVFIGDRDNAEGVPEAFATPIADMIKATQADLEHMGWGVRWIEGADHGSTLQQSAPLAGDFLRKSLGVS